MKTTNSRLIETLAALAAALALAGSACESSSAIALHADAAPTATTYATGGSVATSPDAATATPATGGTLAASQAADPPPIPDAVAVVPQVQPDAAPIPNHIPTPASQPDAAPIAADAAPVVVDAQMEAAPIVANADPVVVDASPVVVDMQVEAGPVVLGSCGTGMQEILLGTVASCVPIPGFVAPDAGPVVHIGPPYGRCGVGFLDPPAIPTANGCTSCYEGTCITSTCGDGKLGTGEMCDCGTDPMMLPSGCNGINGVDFGDGKGCTTDCLRLAVERG